MRFAILYVSKSGQTKEKAQEISSGLQKRNHEVKLFSIEDPVDKEYLESCQGVLIGTPTYMASYHWKIKQWFDEESRGISLSGRLGGVFATAHYAQGGADIALMNMIGLMMVKGMLLYSGGAALGKPFIHLGPVALDSVGNHYEESQKEFILFGERFAMKAEEIF